MHTHYDVPGMVLMVIVFVAIGFFSSATPKLVAARKRFMAGVGGIVVFGLSGGVLGAVLGFLFRPSVPIIGQPPLEAVLNKGLDLNGMDMLWASAAAQSFNYMMIGAILGAGILGIGRASMHGSSSRKPVKAASSSSPFPKVAPSPSPRVPPIAATTGSSICAPGGTGSTRNAFCTKCGTTLRHDVVFCGKCGTRRE